MIKIGICTHDTDLNKIVEEGFSMDTLGIKDPIQSIASSKNAKKPVSLWTTAEIAADSKMIVTHIKEPSHYTCSIPWKHGIPQLTNNCRIIKLRQNRTTSSGYLTKKGTSMIEIREYFQKLETKGYITKMDPKSQTDKDSYYLPWFPVIDRTRDTTKMRIVFDASAKDSEGKSLNSEIESTPNRLNDLFTIIMRFRMYRYTLTADVSEMFLRIKMIHEDKKYHRFFIENDVYQWDSVIFGEMSSPDISQKVINFCAESQNLLLAKEIIDDYTYMDDTICSLRTSKQVYQTCLELIKCYKKCNMSVAKFYSNSRSVVKKLPKDLLSTKVIFSSKDAEIEASKVLGMIYDAKTDVFKYKCKFNDIDQFFRIMNLKTNQDWTKRLILKFSATCYDPIGFISPFTVRARSILQILWTKELSWDQPIPDDIGKLWTTWLTEMFQLKGMIEIPRHLCLDKCVKTTLHVFVDASTLVFAAVAYLVVSNNDTLKTTDDTNLVNTSVFTRGEDKSVVLKSYIVAAKARVTPTKTESVSRLELASCVIGVRLGHAVAKCYNIEPEEIIYWTDSKNCLFWINSSSNLLKTFVAHRVGEIQNHSKIENWRPVPTAINPADIATRPPSIQSLAANTRWWTGPEFLTRPESSWPPKFVPPECNDDGKPEFKKFSVMTAALQPLDEVKRCLDPERYSVGILYDGFKRLIKITAIFIASLVRRKITHHTYNAALKLQLYKAQEDSSGLGQLRIDLDKGFDITDKRYTSLCPFICKDGLIRAKSRLQFCDNLSYETKNPVVLDKEGRFTKLLVQSYHWKYGHAVGEEDAKARLKARYHIIGLSNMVTNARTGCKVCNDRRRKPFVQIESPYPQYRFEEPLKAFAKTGLDFAGPFEVKVGRGRARQKVYILVFTCMQIRAIHLEVTDSQDMTSVMNAISRFIDIRGMPTDILSDNFSTFISKDKELEDWVRHLDLDMMIKPIMAEVKWHLTPPLAPHHGGIYESMVKSTKRALKTIMTGELLDFDTFRTFVSRSAALVNGRPLKRVTEDSSSYILTPNHFLIGNLGGAVTTEHLTPFKKWKEIVRLQDEFWKLLIKHYLPELKRLRKWKIVNPDVKIDQLVAEIQPSLGTGHWRLARIIELIPSPDGKIRKVKIKNSNGIFERAITSLCPLELD